MCTSPVSLTCINSIPTVSMHSHSFPCLVHSVSLFYSFPLFTPQLPGHPLPPSPLYLPSPFSTLPPSPPSSHFLHHDPLLYLFKPVLLSLLLLVSPSTQSLILCFLILPRETPDIRSIHPSLVSKPPPPSSLYFQRVHFLSGLHKQGRNNRGKNKWAEK